MEAREIVNKSAAQVWEGLAQPGALRELCETFAGWGARFRVVADRGMIVGAPVEVTTPGGDPVMSWRVTSSAPPTTLELSSTEEERKLSPFHMVLSFRIEALDDDKSQVSAELTLMFLDRMLELATLILPFGFFYGQRLKRSLKRLRRLIEA